MCQVKDTESESENLLGELLERIEITGNDVKSGASKLDV